MKRIASALCLIALTGCTSPHYNFPSDISGECFQAKNEAKASIEACGTKPADDYSVRVTKHIGEKKFGPMWCWYYSDLDCYVGGLCHNGSWIEIGCNPENQSEVFYPVEKHEFGHYWIIPLGMFGHPAQFKDQFYNWFDPRSFCIHTSEISDVKLMIKKTIEVGKKGDWFGVDWVDTKGNRLHADVVVDK